MSGTTMAELRDWLNRTVVHLDLHDAGSEFPFGDIRIVFQKEIFINNTVGWGNDVRAEIKVYNFCFSRHGIDEFVDAAERWLALPIALLGSTYFSGKWRFGANSSQLNLEFQPYYQTPSKTDWFAVRIEIGSETLSWAEEIHSDASCLALFVEGLSDIRQSLHQNK